MVYTDGLGVSPALNTVVNTSAEASEASEANSSHLASCASRSLPTPLSSQAPQPSLTSRMWYWILSIQTAVVLLLNT